MTRKVIFIALVILCWQQPLWAGLKAGDIDPKTGQKIKYWVAPMDPTYIRKEFGQSPMGMDLVPVYVDEGAKKLPKSSIRIDPVTEQNMGVRYGFVRKQVLDKNVKAFGRITYNQKKIYTISSRVAGWVTTLSADFIGKKVEKSEPLYTLFSPTLVAAQHEYLLAYQQNVRLQQESSKTLDLARNNAQTLLMASKLRLESLGMSSGQIKILLKKQQVLHDVSFPSPVSGVVISKNIEQGSYVGMGKSQYKIADLSSVWVEVEVPQTELAYVKKGMTATMEVSALPGKVFEGKVLYIYPYLEKKSRTVIARLLFANPDGELRPEMYANIRLHALLPDKRIMAPKEAIVDSGKRKVIFVSRGEGIFSPRTVETGVTGKDGMVEILSGVKEGEKIVLSGQFLLDSEANLQEAIQKMLEPTEADGNQEKAGEDTNDLDLSDMTME